jgi:hypothetical protein
MMEGQIIFECATVFSYLYFVFVLLIFKTQDSVIITKTIVCIYYIRYQWGNQNSYIEEEQTTHWPKKVQKDKQRSAKHTH